MTAIFFHIPKTAGTTFQEIIRKNVPRRNLLHLREEEIPRPQEILEQTHEKAIVFGHFRYMEDLIQPQHYTFTFLRQPIDRCISNFFHYRRHGKLKNIPLMDQMESFLSEDELLKNGNFNMQTQFMAGYVRQKDFINEPGKYLTLARENLRKLGFVGIAEKFEYSSYMICRELDWKRWYYIRHNTGSHEKTRDRILNAFGPRLNEITALDQELYRYGCEIFEEQRKRIELPPRQILKARSLSLMKKLWKYAHFPKTFSPFK